MKVSIVGLGKMGQLVLQASKELGIQIISTIDPINKQADFSQINANSLKNSDVCICFTKPQVAFENIEQIAACKKKIVMATTGWEDKLEQARVVVAKHNTTMIYSSNFSVGVNIFFQIILQATKVIDQFTDYDLFGWEMHHNRKLDSPSGTAKTIVRLLLENTSRKTRAIYHKINGKIAKEELHFSSLRGGDIVGTHCVGFDSTFDSIELKHTAKNRIGFAKGSLIAADWIMQKESGLYTEKDLMEHLLSGK